MITRRLTLVMLAALFLLPVVPGRAAEKVKVDNLTVKTLPAETYPLLQKGKKLSLLWKADGFTPSRGFKVGKIEWKAEDRVAEVSTTLKAQIVDIASPTGLYTLDLAITEAKAGTLGYVHNTTGFFILEGQVKDVDGKVVAAFITKEESAFAGMNYTLTVGVDKAISGIASELFK